MVKKTRSFSVPHVALRGLDSLFLWREKKSDREVTTYKETQIHSTAVTTATFTEYTNYIFFAPNLSVP
jgi:hypothetical protein